MWHPGIPCYTHAKEFYDEFVRLIPLNSYFLPINLNVYPFSYIDFLFLFIENKKIQVSCLF